MATATEGLLVLKGKEKEESLILTSGASGRVTALFSLQALRTLLAFLNAVVLVLLFPFRKGTVLRLAFFKSPCATAAVSRRSLAIRRVLEERDSSRWCRRDDSLLPTSRGDIIFQALERGVVILIKKGRSDGHKWKVERAHACSFMGREPF